MTKPLLRFSLSLIVSFFFFTGFGQSFSGTYDFSSFTATTDGRVDPTPPPEVTGVTFGSFSAAATVSAHSTAANSFIYTSWPLGATNGSDVFPGTLDDTKYYEVTLTPKTYY